MSSLRALAVLILFSTASIAGAEELRTLSGKNVTGTLKSIDANNIVIGTDAGPVETPLSQALLLDLRPARTVPSDAKVFEVRLLDDSNILAQSVTYSGKDVELKLLSGSTLKVPLAALVSVLRDAQNTAIRKQFQNLTHQGQGPHRSHLHLQGRRAELRGRDARRCRGRRQGDRLQARRRSAAQGSLRVAARHDLPAYRSAVRGRDLQGDRPGRQHAQRLQAELRRHDTEHHHPDWAPSRAAKGEALAKLDFNLGRLTYLSDLEPAKLSESAFFAGFPSVRKDVNQDGRPIVLLDRTFAKGLTLEGASAVEYNLGGKYKDFKAIVGADTRTAEGALGKTSVIVYCDGAKRLIVEVSPSELKTIALNVSDVGTLRIVVEGPNFTGLSAYVTLAEARISQ